MNVMMLLEMAASAFPDRPAFTDGSSGQSLTYQQLFDGARLQGRQLLASQASRAVKLDVSNLGTPLCLFASACAGIPYVPLNYRLTDAEIGKLLERVTPAYLVTDAARVNGFSEHAEVTSQSSPEFVAQSQSGGDLLTEWPMDPEEIAVLLFTSGTTGEPKAAMLRHKHLVSYILSSVEFAGAPEGDAALVCVPPYHIAGIAAIMSSVYAGRHVVQLPNFDAETWVDLVVQHKVSTAFVVPTMLARIVEHVAASGRSLADLSCLTSLAYGGGKMPLAVIQKAMRLFPDTDFSNAYGLTETSSTVAVLGPDAHRAAAASQDPDVQRRLVSVGQALPGVEIEIRDEDGNLVGADERGEIYVRGEQVSGEYEGRGPVTDSEGWFPTRDAGSIDSQGYLFLLGRADDIIVRGGENLSPGEIEDVLLTHAAVADVAVVGVPDEQWGEGVAAAVVFKVGQQAEISALQDYVKERMRSSRVPQFWEVWPELPYNETGKLLRRIVRERLGAVAAEQ